MVAPDSLVVAPDGAVHWIDPVYDDDPSVSRSEAERELARWREEGRVAGDEVRYRDRRSQIDATYVLADDGSVWHVQVRIGPIGRPRGRASEARHRAAVDDRVAARAVWSDERPGRTQIALRLPEDLAAAVDERAAELGLPRHDLLVQLIEAGLDEGGGGLAPTLRRRLRDRLREVIDRAIEEM